MAVTVRGLEPGELVPAAIVVASACVAGYRGIIPDVRLGQLLTSDALRLRADNLAVEAQHPDYRMLAAVDDGDAVIGLVGWWRDLDHLEVEALYVHPDQWGSATASALLEHVQRMAVTDGTHIELWTLEANQRARRFYERMGLVLSPQRRLISYLDETVARVRYRGVSPE